MKSLARMLLLSALAFLAACTTGPQIKSDYDRSANFASYRTFAFFDPLGTDTAGYESLVTQTIKSAVRQQMESRGYVYADTGADLLVNFNGKLQEQTRIQQVPTMMGPYYGYRGGYYGGWGGYGYDTYVYEYTEGTLNIDIVDARRKQLVWEGVAVGRVTRKHEQNRDATLRAAVAEIFTRYPFRAGGG
jgi:hypothetical protein